LQLFLCNACVEVVSAVTWSDGTWAQYVAGDVEPTCRRCGGADLHPWAAGEMAEGDCPVCGETVAAIPTGIAD